MPKKRTNMRKLREVVRLKFELGRTHREMATSCKISSGTVSDMAKRLPDAGPRRPYDLSNKDLEAVLHRAHVKEIGGNDDLVVPSWESIHHEFRRRDYHMTLKLLWQEYKAANPDAFYHYSWFYKHYRGRSQTIDPVMRQVHEYGDKLPIFNSETGETRMPEVFVGTLGASNYIYCDAC